jgi:hypothetical protein
MARRIGLAFVFPVAFTVVSVKVGDEDVRSSHGNFVIIGDAYGHTGGEGWIVLRPACLA